ncbi:MAG: hypothetical protein IJ553_02945 [Alloprevotella sp.]|nr:hypothetical protein [Alloprevotella sp.]
MKLLKLFSIALLGLSLSACGDDNDETIFTIDNVEGHYSGTFVEKVAGADYASATLGVNVVKTGPNTLRIEIDDFQASPGNPSMGIPPTMMEETVISNVRLEEVSNGQFRLVNDPLQAVGTYNGTEFVFNGTFEGTWTLNVLNFAMSFQMGRMPYPVEATFTGVYQD